MHHPETPQGFSASQPPAIGRSPDSVPALDPAAIMRSPAHTSWRYLLLIMATLGGISCSRQTGLSGISATGASAEAGAPSGPAYTYVPEKAAHLSVDSARLWKWCQDITAIGPRVSGSHGAEACRVYLEKELQALGWETRRRDFTDSTPQGTLPFANLHARYAGPTGGDALWERSVPTLVCSHYDTKWFSSGTFVGANDGGSGNAACLEMARIASKVPGLAERIEIVFFDGEEAFVEFTATDGLYGSRYLQKDIRSRPPHRRPKNGLLFDMIADKDLNIGIPPNSSGRIASLAMTCAQELGYGKHFGVYRSEILDDHVPLMMAGVEMTDFIDLDYRPWHTMGDTVDAISSESLTISTKVGVMLVEKHLVP